MPEKRSKALLISASDFNNDSRLKRLHAQLENAGFEVTTIAYGNNEDKANFLFSPVPERSFLARVLDLLKMLASRILPEKALLKMLSQRLITRDVTRSALKAADEHSYDLFVVKHWTSLPSILHLGSNVRIWLDINEVFEAEHDNSKLWQLIYKPVIIRLLKIADRNIILRSATSLDQIRHMQHVDVLYLPNTKKPCARPEQYEDDGKIRLLYHGLITTNRSLETLITALQKSGRKDMTLTIRGNGKPGYIARLKALVTSMELSDQIEFEPSIPNAALIREASQYDIGFCLFENQSLQLMYSEPNKLYEYMAAGLGIIASNTATMKRMVKDKGLGEVTDISANQSDEIANILSTLTRDTIQQWKSTSHTLARKTWEENYDWSKLGEYLKTIVPKRDE